MLEWNDDERAPYVAITKKKNDTTVPIVAEKSLRQILKELYDEEKEALFADNTPYVDKSHYSDYICEEYDSFDDSINDEAECEEDSEGVDSDQSEYNENIEDGMFKKYMYT